MSLTQKEKEKLEDIYSLKIIKCSEGLNKYGGKSSPRYQTYIKFDDGSHLSRTTASWRLETKIGRKMHTSRLGGIEECDHIDGNGLNDHIDNLQVLTQKENQNKMVRQNKLFGENSHLSKITKKNVINIWDSYYSGTPIKIISEKFNIDAANVVAIVKRKSWKQLNLKIPDNKIITNLHCGNNNIFSKLTEKSVREIWDKYYSGTQAYILAKEYNVDNSSISGIINGKYWKHLNLQKPINFVINNTKSHNAKQVLDYKIVNHILWLNTVVGFTCPNISRMLDVNKCTVYNVLTNVSWRHIPRKTYSDYFTQPVMCDDNLKSTYDPIQ